MNQGLWVIARLIQLLMIMLTIFVTDVISGSLSLMIVTAVAYARSRLTLSSSVRNALQVGYIVTTSCTCLKGESSGMANGKFHKSFGRGRATEDVGIGMGMRYKL